MKKILLLLSVCIIIFACNNSSENNSVDNAPKELHVYNWTNVIPQEILKKFEDQFKVRLVYDNYSSNEEMLAKVQTNGHNYDVVFPSDYMVEIMIKQGLLEKLDLKNIPNSKNVSEQFMHTFFDPSNDYSMPFQWSTVGIAVNVDKVNNVRTSWDMLFDEEFKNRISMLDDMRYGIAPALIKLGFDPNTTNPQQLDAAKKLMIEQKKLVKAYSSDTYIDLIKSGEVWLAYGYSIDILQIGRTMPQIKYILPEEGTTMAIESMCIPKGSNRKVLAEQFINFILNAKNHAEITNYSLATNPNKAAFEFIRPDLKSNKNIFPDSSLQKKLIYLRDVGDFTQQYDRTWNEIKNY